MLTLVVLSFCLAGCLAKPSIGYSYSAYAPIKSYAPYQSLLTPYTLKATSGYAYSAPVLSAHVAHAPAPLVYSAPAPAPAVYTVAAPVPAPAVYTVPAPAPAVYAPHAPAVTVVETGVKSQYHTQDYHGQASYGHSEPSQSHTAVQDAHGNKIGSFSYVKPDGHVHRTDYVADAEGYRVASNDLPVGPAAAPEHVVPVAPEHVAPVVIDAPTVPAETPEVIAAKAAHFAAHAHALHKRSVYGYASPVVTPNGYIADTPEVVAAKAAHFAEHAKRGGAYHYSPHYAGYTPVVTPSGYLADTPEVAAAKAAHFAEKAKVSSHYSPAYPAAYSAYGQYPVITPSGHVADTPEVAAAKAAHFAEHAAASARAAHSKPYDEYYDKSWDYEGSAPYSYAAHSGYSAWAAPVLTPSGHIADTPEVAHAKAAHLAEYAAVASRHKRSILYGQTPASTSPLYYSAPAYPTYAPYAYAAAPYLYGASPYYAKSYLKPATHTSIVHGPHAVSYTIA